MARSVHFNPYQRAEYERQRARSERRAQLDAERCAAGAHLTDEDAAADVRSSSPFRPSPDPEPEGP